MSVIRRRLLVSLAITWLLSLFVTAMLARAWERWQWVRLARAYEYAGELLANPSEDLQGKVLEPLGLPPIFATPKEAAIAVLLIADAMDSGGSTDADHLLGLFLLEGDCDGSKFFFRKHLKKVGSDDVVERSLELLEKEGCEEIVSRRTLQERNDKRQE